MLGGKGSEGIRECILRGKTATFDQKIRKVFLDVCQSVFCKRKEVGFYFFTYLFINISANGSFQPWGEWGEHHAPSHGQ